MQSNQNYLKIFENPLAPLALAVLVIVLLGFLSNLARYAPQVSPNTPPAPMHRHATGAEQMSGRQ